MHRSYYPYNPASSKLLQKRWDEKAHEKHVTSVVKARPQIDSNPPITFMHLHLKLKKLQLEEERLATIERDNRILLEKMSKIMRTKGKIDNDNDVQFKSLSRDRKEREMLRIAKENMNMFKRINNKKPAISVQKLEHDWNQNLKYMDNISSYPEDWYLREKHTARSNPNVSTNRSIDKETKKNDLNKSTSSEKNTKTKADNKKDDKEEKKEEKNYEEDFDEN